MSVSWEALAEDIRRTRPQPGEPASWAFHQLITDTARLISEGDIVMAKPKPPPPGTGKVPSKTGAKHDANGIKVTNSKGKLDGLGKHAKPGKK